MMHMSMRRNNISSHISPKQLSAVEDVKTTTNWHENIKKVYINTIEYISKLY